MNLSPISSAQPSFPPTVPAEPTEAKPKVAPGLDALAEALPRTHGLAAKLAAASRSRWLTFGAPVAVVVLGAGAATAILGGWVTPGGAPLQDGAREDLTRSILHGDRSDGPDAPRAVGTSPEAPAPSRTDGPDASERPGAAPVGTRSDAPDPGPQGSALTPAETGNERTREREGTPRRGTNASTELERTARPFAPIHR